MNSRYLLLVCCLLCMRSVGQPCQSNKLDPRVAQALRTVLPDLTVTPTRSLEQIRSVRIPTLTFPAADVEKLKITADSISIQIYNPTHKQGLPVILSLHAGGFVTPLLPFMEYEMWRQARDYQALVIAVDYRVAPEHPYPAAVTDVYQTFKWLLRSGHRYGGDTTRLVVLGASAGGNLAAVVCQKAKQEGLAHRIKLQILNCASVDSPLNAEQHSSYQQYASGYFLTKAFCQYYIGAYAPGVSRDHPEVAPFRQLDVSGLPPAVVITAEYDPVRDEGYEYAQRLKQAGGKVWYKCFPGQIHCLVGLPPDANELRQLDKVIVSAMREVFGY